MRSSTSAAAPTQQSAANLATLLTTARSKVADDGPASVANWVRTVVSAESVHVRGAGVPRRPRRAAPRRRRSRPAPQPVPQDSRANYPALGAQRSRQRTTRTAPRRGRGKGNLVDIEFAAEQQPANDAQPAAGRYMLTGDRRRARGSTLRAECNGVVVDAATWQPLSVPPRAFARSPSHRAVDQHLAAGRYTMVRASDATVATLYHWNMTWCVSTNNGYDVSGLKWMGGLTYAEILFELLGRVPDFVAATGMTLDVEAGNRLGFEGLDTGRCYTVGFRHHNFHPLRSDPEGIWNIQSVDLKTLERSSTLGLPGIACQPPLEIPPDSTFESISQSLAGSLDDAVAVIGSDCEAKSDSFVYGYILRAADPASTPGCADVLIESDLLQTVRRLMYNRPPMRDAESLDHDGRQLYHALRAYLTPADRTLFVALFPDLCPQFKRIADFVSAVVSGVVMLARQRRMSGGRDSPATTRLQTIVAMFLDLILRDAPQFDVGSKDAINVIKAYVVQPVYAATYLVALR